MRTPIIIDTDPGIDDAVAILLALEATEKLDIKLITTTTGNIPVKLCTNNALYICQNFAKYDIDIAEGDELADNINASDVHGALGLGNVIAENISKTKLNENAVESIYNTLMKSEQKMVIVALGPLTNISKLLKLHPDCKDKIDYIFIMGGSINGEGNITPYAEFNVYKNPEAFFDIINNDVKLVFSPIHLGHESAMKLEMLLAHKVETKKEQFLHDLFAGANEPFRNGWFCIHDAQVSMGLLHPELYSFESCDATICLEGKKRGQVFMNMNPNGKFKVQMAKDVEEIKRILYKEMFS